MPNLNAYLGQALYFAYPLDPVEVLRLALAATDSANGSMRLRSAIRYLGAQHA
jgi:hypothetical protein